MKRLIMSTLSTMMLITTAAKTDIKDSLMKDYIRCWTYYAVSAESAELYNLIEQSQIDLINLRRNLMFKTILKLAKEKNIKSDDLISSMTEEQEEHRSQNMLLTNLLEYSKKHREFCKTLPTLISE